MPITKMTTRRANPTATTAVAPMNESIENRVPYLDAELAHYSFNLPNNFKIRADSTRYILKDVFKTNPSTLYNRFPDITYNSILP